MKLLIWHCRHLSYRDKRPSNRPEGVEQFAAEAVAESFTDVLAAFVCVEKEDGEERSLEAVDEILKLVNLMKRREVVIVPFAHLSSRLMTDGARARELIRGVFTGLERAGIDAALTSFAFHKDFKLDFEAEGHAGAVAFREIPRSPQASEPGLRRSMQPAPAAPDTPPSELPAA